MHNVYSVSQVNSYIKNMFAQDYMLGLVSVRGEVSNLKYHSSRHIYFTLKDEGAAIQCVMFAGDRKGLHFVMEEGMQVVATGSVSVYERDGKYQLYAKEIRQEGQGNLNEQFEALKEKLADMGLFAAEYKQKIPKYIHKLGVVTAPTGAAVQDIINVSLRRNPYLQIIIYPAIVQGDQAPESIVRGIKMLEQYGVDTIIVGRGGGSMEDLWGFNEEIVAQAIFDCMVPIISAVGHETDFTIADFVADMRAPTPSAAAELAVADIDVISQQIEQYERRLNYLWDQHLLNKKNLLRNYELRLNALSPKNIMDNYRMNALSLEERLQFRMNEIIKQKKHEFEMYGAKLQGLSPLAKLNQGYGHIENTKGKTVSSIASVKEDEILDIYVQDGVIKTKVVDTKQISYKN